MSRLVQVLLCMAGGLWLASSAAPAAEYDAMDCQELWQARNQVFADRGFCFKSERAIEVFGKRCFAPYGRLDEAGTKLVEDIRRRERELRCKIEQ